MIEILRRVLLVAGLGASLVLALYTPPLLLHARYADFARDYANYDSAPWPADVLHALVEKPATLDDYIADKTGRRRVNVSGQTYVSFLERLKQPPASGSDVGGAAESDRTSVYLTPEDPPLAQLMPAFFESRNSGWLNTYVVVTTPAGPEYFEVLLVTEPRDSRAPAAMVYPLRRSAWWPLLAGLFAYALFPRAVRRSVSSVTYDPLGSVLPLDALGALWFSICVWVPLRATDSMSEALGEEFGLTVFFGLASLLALPLFYAAARRSAYEIEPMADRLVISSLLSRREIGFGQITAVEPLMARAVQTGIVLKVDEREAINLDWTDLERFELLLEALPPTRPTEPLPL